MIFFLSGSAKCPNLWHIHTKQTAISNEKGYKQKTGNLKKRHFTTTTNFELNTHWAKEQLHVWSL
jgi:hypothetical protein